MGESVIQCTSFVVSSLLREGLIKSIFIGNAYLLQGSREIFCCSCPLVGKLDTGYAVLADQIKENKMGLQVLYN